MPSYPKLKLTYFDTVGRAETIRLAFHLGGVPFEDERISREEFAKRKPNFVYGQVPVLEVDGVELAQSEAILRYAGKLGGLYPVNDPVAALQVDEFIAGVEEMASKVKLSNMEQDVEKRKAMRIDLANVTLPRYLSILNSRLAEMKKDPVFQTGNVFIHELAIYAQLLHLHSGRLDDIPSNIAESHVEIMAAFNKVSNHPKVLQWNAMRAQASPKLKLTYLDLPARAEATRLAFIIGNIPFEDERIDRAEVKARKDILPFGQVPVLEVNGRILSQSMPILRYAGVLSGLYPTNDPLLALRIDEIVSLNDDINAATLKVARMENAEAKVDAVKTLVKNTIPGFAGSLDKRIAKWGGPYAVGEMLTIADLLIYNMVVNIKSFKSRINATVELDSFENIMRVCKQVCEHDKVKTWLAEHSA